MDDDPNRHARLTAIDDGPRSRWAPVLLGVIIVTVSLTAIWWVEGFDSICLAIYPAPPECAPDARRNAARASSVAVVLVFAVVVLVSVRRRQRTLVGLCMGALVAAGVVGCSATLDASGFVFPG